MHIQWDDFIDWYFVLPPNRPTVKYLSLIRVVCATFDRSSPVCVLGSTPEIRDILAAMAFQTVYVIDVSETYHSRTAALRAYDNNEIFVKGDWLSILPMHKNMFSLVFSDLTSGNIPYVKRPQFYDNIASSLQIGGFFVDRILTHSHQFLALDDLDHKYCKLPFNLRTVNNFSSEYLFLSELLQQEHLVNSSRFYDQLFNRFQQEHLQLLLRACGKVTPRDAIWYYGHPWSDLEPSYAKRLSLVASEPDEANTVFSERTLIRVSKKR